MCSFIVDIAIVFLLNATSEVAQEAFRAMKDSVKYIIGKYGNDRAKYHIIIRHPDDCSFQSHEICFNTPHVNVTALTDAVEELQTEGDKYFPELHKDLQKVTEAFESNTLKSDAQKVRSSSSSLSSSSPSSVLGSLRSDDFCSATPLEFVTCLLRMPIRELRGVVPKSMTLVKAICRYLKTTGTVLVSSDTLDLCGEAFEGRARCDCILKVDCDTDHKSYVLL